MLSCSQIFLLQICRINNFKVNCSKKLVKPKKALKLADELQHGNKNQNEETEFGSKGSTYC